MNGILTLFLAFSVVFINGFTDAPNAIATAVCSGAVKMKNACLLCAIFNFLGVFVISLFNNSVANSVFSLARFEKHENLGVCVCFITVIAFGVIAWAFALPSSESHALVSAISGVSLAVCKKSDNLDLLLKIILFMIISCIFSFILSYLITKILKKAVMPYGKLQIFSSAVASFMHGAQDGQKFLGIMIFLSAGKKISVPLVFSIAVVMALGTSLGGGRIIKSIGEDTVKLNGKRGFVSDVSTGICLLICSLSGFPVSTSNIKTCSVIGAGVADRQEVNKKTAIKLLAVSVITFPACFLFAFLVTELFIF